MTILDLSLAKSRRRSRRLLSRLSQYVRRWHDRQRQRAYLASLDDRLLADIGLSRADQERECNKPFWHL